MGAFVLTFDFSGVVFSIKLWNGDASQLTIMKGNVRC
jgi:hypothetical protein